ncbi:hypothetical protein FQR65_LT17185 [Abscondita terminalis]|nr:hypothetical protein FQR65_LT17185 [Abscondita terminalis]
MMDMDLELNESEMHLYSRQILLDGWDLEAQEKLKLANILIVGCGGIGCTTAELLARAGVGKISLIDADIIEISNLQRQIAYVEPDIGFYKAEILAKRLQQINPFIQVEHYTNRLDQQNAQMLISQQDLGIIKTMLSMELLFPKGQQQNESLRCADSGVLATTPNVIASLQAHHALLYLGLGRTPLKQKLLLWDGLTMKQRILSFEKDQDCTNCQLSHTANAD